MKSNQKEETVDVTAAEEVEDRERAALVHKLTEAASKFALHAEPAILVKITNQVAEAKRGHDFSKVDFMSRLKELKKVAQKARQDAVTALNAEFEQAMHSINVQEKAGFDDLNAAFKARTDELEDELSAQVKYISDLVAAFKKDLDHLDKEQLTDLLRDGVVEVKKGEWMHIPGKES